LLRLGTPLRRIYDRRTKLQDHAANGARQIRHDVVTEAVAGGLGHSQVSCRRARALQDAGLSGHDEAATARGKIAEEFYLDAHDWTVEPPAGPVIDAQIEQRGAISMRKWR
jgi:hypothetical protein